MRAEPSPGAPAVPDELVGEPGRAPDEASWQAACQWLEGLASEEQGEAIMLGSKLLSSWPAALRRFELYHFEALDPLPPWWPWVRRFESHECALAPVELNELLGLIRSSTVEQLALLHLRQGALPARGPGPRASLPGRTLLDHDPRASIAVSQQHQLPPGQLAVRGHPGYVSGCAAEAEGDDETAREAYAGVVNMTPEHVLTGAAREALLRLAQQLGLSRRSARHGSPGR